MIAVMQVLMSVRLSYRTAISNNQSRAMCCDFFEKIWLLTPFSIWWSIYWFLCSICNCSGWAFSEMLPDGGSKKATLPKICHTYPTLIKLGTPYLKMIQKIYKSHDILLEFYCHQHFYTQNQELLLYQELQI